ncbi:MAG: TetR/AcrR family transcriptional regulator [Bdellovibrionales bacterium]|nr:TetR/AcrR family transcriptional regulator [Bdellovibrionales bacterium]
MCPFKPSKPKKPEMTSEELKAHIILVARKHFALQGFNGASLKEIASEAQIANSLINYHFKDKGGLFRACMETFARDRMAAIKRILSEPRNRDEVRLRIELFVEEMLASIVADPHGFDIIDREMRLGNPEVLQLFQETMLQAFTSAIEFFKEAQKSGFIREGANPLILASMLFTTTCDSARKEILAKRFFNVSFTQEEWRKEFAQNIVDLFMYGVMK